MKQIKKKKSEKLLTDAKSSTKALAALKILDCPLVRDQRKFIRTSNPKNLVVDRTRNFFPLCQVNRSLIVPRKYQNPNNSHSFLFYLKYIYKYKKNH